MEAKGEFRSGSTDIERSAWKSCGAENVTNGLQEKKVCPYFLKNSKTQGLTPSR
jgi:hypothetical protein